MIARKAARSSSSFKELIERLNLRPAPQLPVAPRCPARTQVKSPSGPPASDGLAVPGPGWGWHVAPHRGSIGSSVHPASCVTGKGVLGSDWRRATGR